MCCGREQGQHKDSVAREMRISGEYGDLEAKGGVLAGTEPWTLMGVTMMYGRRKTRSLEVTRSSPVTLTSEDSAAVLTGAQPKGWGKERDCGNWTSIRNNAKMVL